MFFFFLLKFQQIYMNCDDWSKGLNNTYIENNKNKYSCDIIFPAICPYKIGKYIFDFSKMKGIKCKENKQNTKDNLLHFSNYLYINENTKRIGFPLVNKSPLLLLNNNSISKFVKERLVDMDNKKLVKEIYNDNYPEIIVDYTRNNYGELEINLNYNETLSKERKLLEKNSCPYSRNIIILYVDSVSRSYSIRQLKKTLQFFEQFMSYKGGFNPKFPQENFHSFQFFKYHSFQAYTKFNYPKIFYGNSAGENMVRITKYLKDNGYITSYINDICLREPTNMGHNMINDEICDHELIICDPNMSHVNSHLKRCLYNKLSTEQAYEYGSQFWEKYKNNRKFLTIATNDGHEGTLEILKYIDNILFNFLNKLFKENLFKDTTIFLLSDHGTGIPSPYYFNQFFQIERHLPMLYIICNDRKNIPYNIQYLNMNKNQQIIITGYDIYNTIGNLIYGDKYYLIKNKTEDEDSPKSKLIILI